MNDSRQTASSYEKAPVARVERDKLIRFVVALLEAGGMDNDKALDVAEIVVEGDMIGHGTHGVSQIPWYLDSLANGELSGKGEFGVVADRGACFTWDGRQLPGAWLLRRALALACERVGQYGVVSGAISHSHHTCALAAYLREVTEAGYIGLIQSSNPAASRMAPFGGTEPLLTPDPMAAGFPTGGDPVIIDISCSITTTTMTQTLAARGDRYPDIWALTAGGLPTDDPAEVVHRQGSLLPLGGLMKGHKGYAMALMVELMTQGLSGYGRENAPPTTSQSLFIQVIDPEAFAGREAFLRQADYLTAACRSNRPAPGVNAVRVPGDGAARQRRTALNEGVPVKLEALDQLQAHAGRLGVPLLRAVA